MTTWLLTSNYIKRVLFIKVSIKNHFKHQKMHLTLVSFGLLIISSLVSSLPVVYNNNMEKKSLSLDKKSLSDSLLRRNDAVMIPRGDIGGSFLSGHILDELT